MQTITKEVFDEIGLAAVDLTAHDAAPELADWRFWVAEAVLFAAMCYAGSHGWFIIAN